MANATTRQGGIRFKKSRSDPRLRFQLCRFVGPFPTEFGLITAEMAVAGRLLVDRSPEIERLNDSSGRQVEVFANQFGDFVLVDSPATERVDAHGDRIGNADGVCQLNLDSLGKTRRYERDSTGIRHRRCRSGLRERRRSEEHTSELQSLAYLVCRLLLEKKK